MKTAELFDFDAFKWFLLGLPDLSRAGALAAICHHTMTTPARSRALWDFSRQLLRSGVPGDFVECGVWRGGSAAVMGLALQKFDPRGGRKLHLFDSFEGLPEPKIEDGPQAAEYCEGANSGNLVSVGKCEAPLGEVRTYLLETIKLPESDLLFHQGWFQDTVPDRGSTINQIALLRLDGDWYESTRVCLEHLYDRVSPRGIVILDDYFCWEGCRKATDEFRAERNITAPIIRIDIDSGYWIKHS